MLLRELLNLVESTGDAAFATDDAGVIVAWNRWAEAMFGLMAEAAHGRHCSEILRGTDERGTVCSKNCIVRQGIADRRQISNYDLEVRTQQGRQWSNICVLLASVGNSRVPHSIHVLRRLGVGKSLEISVRAFLVREAGLPAGQVKALTATSRSAARTVMLTNREREILRLLAAGTTTGSMALQLHISRATVNNHVQHILQKLNAHTRLEAVRRAEHAGLI
jgi:PAS domain S-box-containing protein